MTELLAATEEARAVAAAAVRANIKRLVAGQDRDLVTMLRLLGDARARLVAMLATGTEFDQARAAPMLREVDREMAFLRITLKLPIELGYRRAAAQGDADVMAQAWTILPDDALRLSSGVSMNLIDYASQASADLVGQISSQARATINDTLRRAAVGSSRIPDVVAALGTVLGEADRPTGIFGTLSTQVERVHRTATAAFYEGASKARMDRVASESPYEMRKRWISTLDARTRPSHAAMNQTEVAVGEKFVLNGVECDGPQDSVLPAEDAVNCRCTTALVRGERKAGR